MSSFPARHGFSRCTAVSSVTVVVPATGPRPTMTSSISAWTNLRAVPMRPSLPWPRSPRSHIGSSLRARRARSACASSFAAGTSSSRRCATTRREYTPSRPRPMGCRCYRRGSQWQRIPRRPRLWPLVQTSTRAAQSRASGAKLPRCTCTLSLAMPTQVSTARSYSSVPRS